MLHAGPAATKIKLGGTNFFESKIKDGMTQKVGNH